MSLSRSKLRGALVAIHSKLHHGTPGWVESGAFFHIRLRHASSSGDDLTSPAIASELLNSVEHYSKTGKWYHYLFLLMPDHIHALLAFPRDASMSRTIGYWKRFHTRKLGIQWQENYFDHRIRGGSELSEKAQYIRMNPVVEGLCSVAEDWPWVIGTSCGGLDRDIEAHLG